jgi:hypothetical protein
MKMIFAYLPVILISCFIISACTQTQNDQGKSTQDPRLAGELISNEE